MKRLLTVLLLLVAIGAKGQQTYDYRDICPGYCGPAAIAWATGADRVEVGRLMDWQHHHALGGIREDLQDSPSAHKLAVLKLGFRYIPRTALEIMLGHATPNKTVILVHNPRSPLTQQHWITLSGLDPQGYVLAHWGDGSIRRMLDFDGWFSSGAPTCAYEVIPNPGAAAKLPWYHRAWFWLFRRIA
jgi:hypothetical protein